MTMSVAINDLAAVLSEDFLSPLQQGQIKTAVREFFVSHEGKKPLTVDIGTSLEGINNEGFFQEMIAQISENINKPEYTNLMESDFSESTSVDRIVASMMLMFSFQEYFESSWISEYGIPGVIMEGDEEDWRNLVVKWR